MSVTSGSALSPEQFDPNIPEILPHEKMYRIQVGKQLFKISGASLNSDGPSFFTNYFLKRTNRATSNNNNAGNNANNAAANNNNAFSPSSVNSTNSPPSGGSYHGSDNEVLFIDRSADIFELIYQHLQGYFIEIQDEVQYTMLFADAMYYNLPRLKAILKDCDYYYTNIGGKSYKLAKSLFKREGDSPNYFEITSGTLYIDVEELILTRKLLRPPPHSAPYVARSNVLFEDLLILLGGGSINLDDDRRSSLIRECKFYRFLNLEQRLVKCSINYNPLTRKEEICLHLKDVSRKGLVISQTTKRDLSYLFQPATVMNQNNEHVPSLMQSQFDQAGLDFSQNSGGMDPRVKRQKLYEQQVGSWDIVGYKRPYLDKYSREFIFQVDSREAILIFNRDTKRVHIDFIDQTAKNFFNLFYKELLNSPDCGIDLNHYKCKLAPSFYDMNMMSPVESNNSNYKPNPHPDLVLPALLTLGDLSIDGVRYPRVASLIDEPRIASKQIPNLDVRPKGSEYSPNEFSQGFQLFLNKSLWKIGVTNGRIILLLLKADSITGTSEYCKSLSYI
ncbi:Uncharacterized protein AO441_003997 [Nakaseomyces glabratus]|uniref:BTB domain-containing protein n=1 Tax=Candida glabrata TaxID=5478 RepID=A0A0W0C6S9_CANGB|nr:hypothetical protein J7296_04280 [Nakaseomyces glabratus]KAH7581547.1 hypothetical protein J7298_04372 [Nakaseomyces glabratus]KAH7582809.1 hypothetical protein J7297_04429 [Nakaseomyces glabratus]KAH7595109.1 hypothetical protein J7295_04332 [Nakaseomyces glabratus]KAH7611193.1 hypothetical protein J7292_04343 [Nakaseomyces glabratus]